MWIRDLQLKDTGNFKEVAAEVDGFTLWYRVSSAIQPSETASPFLAAALLPAMLKGESIDVDPVLTVSPRLVKNMALLQDIHHSWNPLLKKITINATQVEEHPAERGVMVFFSGGVDSTYSFLKHLDEVNTVVFIHGFDFFLADGMQFWSAIERNSRFVSGFGRPLLPVETNYYRFGYRYNLSRVLTQGAALASVALLLGFRKTYVPSAFSFRQLMPLGSHPLTDPLYSTEGVEIIHDGCEAERIEKLQQLSGCQSALENLTVCLTDMNANCGECSKCRRTMIALGLLGASSKRFPPLPPYRSIRKTRIGDAIEMAFFEEEVAFARNSTNVELRNALISCLRRNKRREAVKQLDRELLAGMLMRMHRVIAEKDTTTPRIYTTAQGPAV